MSGGFERLLDSVVRIDVQEFNFEDGARRIDSSIGSGVILSQDGLILTNAHVAGPKAVEINVTLANLERVGAKLVGWDHWTDLSLLRIDLVDAKKRGLLFKHADFGDSERLYVGETVFAVGTPHGLTRTVTRGIISNNNRYFEDTEGVDGYETGNFNTWLQTDAAINPGNSGGPLVTEDGKIVGITSRAYLGANNLGFAIPSVIAKRVVASLVQDGSITRSYVGIVPKALQDLEGFYDVATNNGMLVDSVEAGSPGLPRAGLRAGDVILAIDGKKVDGRFPEQLPPIQRHDREPARDGSQLVLGTTSAGQGRWRRRWSPRSSRAASARNGSRIPGGSRSARSRSPSPARTSCRTTPGYSSSASKGAFRRTSPGSPAGTSSRRSTRVRSTRSTS